MNSLAEPMSYICRRGRTGADRRRGERACCRGCLSPCRRDAERKVGCEG